MSVAGVGSPFTLTEPEKEVLGDLEESSSSTEEIATTNSMIYAYKPGHYHNQMSIPFEPTWAFGIEINTKVFNLTKEKLKCRLFYTASHIAVVYNDTTNTIKFLMGHKNKIVSATGNCTGKWIVTADSEADHSIVVWDSDLCLPVHTIFEPHPPVGTEQICMSADAKYIVSIGRETEPKLKFWVWSLGNQKEDDCLTIKRSYGDLQDISFNPNESRHFMLTFTETILFFTWDNNKLERWIPGTRNIRKKSFGSFQVSTYIENTHDCITATSAGWIIIWGISYFDVPYDSIPVNNKKILIKKIRLQKHRITCLVSVDNVIATGDVRGEIKFYDKTMKILYWYQGFTLDSIIAIEFNLSKRKVEAEIKAKNFKASLCKKTYIRSFDDNEDDDRSEEYAKIYAKILPSDYSLLKSPFFVHDFIVVTSKGQVSYVDFSANKIYASFSTPYTPITSVAVHDAKPLICIGYLNGIICQFNYEENKLTHQEIIMNSKEEHYNEITSILYSSEGLYLACSTAGGHLWFLEPSILKPLVKKPFIYDHSRIHRIQFSTDNRYLAYYDSSLAVCLLKRTNNKTQGFPDWIFHGRFIAHYKRIVDLLFCCSSRLFSISDDRCLVEYDVEHSQPGNLELISRTTVMQSGQPICFMCYYFESQNDKLLFLISTTEYKYYIVNDTGGSLEKMILAPTMGKPVHLTKMVPGINNKHMLFCNNTYLGIQLLPITGNPFKRVAMVVHPTQLKSFKITNCGKYVFTYGYNDNICIMWRINFESVEYMCQIGGTELNPYYCLIEGGVNGWLFNEMKDLFYYMQILHDGEDSPLPRKTYEKIATCELPNLLRSIGFFPSEYELDNILYEVKYYYATTNERGEEEISFENFVKLYINHRPVLKFRLDEIECAFNNFAENGKIDKDDFLQMLTTKGEPFDCLSLQHCLSILMSINKEEDEIEKSDFTILPNIITYTLFINDILGINVGGD